MSVLDAGGSCSGGRDVPNVSDADSAPAETHSVLESNPENLKILSRKIQTTRNVGRVKAEKEASEFLKNARRPPRSAQKRAEKGTKRRSTAQQSTAQQPVMKSYLDLPFFLSSVLRRAPHLCSVTLASRNAQRYAVVSLLECLYKRRAKVSNSAPRHHQPTARLQSLSYLCLLAHSTPAVTLNQPRISTPPCRSTLPTWRSPPAPSLLAEKEIARDAHPWSMPYRMRREHHHPRPSTASPPVSIPAPSRPSASAPRTIHRDPHIPPRPPSSSSPDPHSAASSVYTMTLSHSISTRSRTWQGQSSGSLPPPQSR